MKVYRMAKASRLSYTRAEDRGHAGAREYPPGTSFVRRTDLETEHGRSIALQPLVDPTVYAGWSTSPFERIMGTYGLEEI